MKYTKVIEHLAFPPKCIICGALLTQDEREPFCAECQSKLCFVEEERCYGCGRGIGHCVCTEKEHAYNSIASAFYYKEPLTKLLLNLKQYENGYAIRMLSHIAARTAKAAYSDVKFDLMLCVPSSKKSTDRVKFDRMDLFARKLSQMLRLKYDPHALKKVRETRKQHEISYEERLLEQRDAYLADHSRVHGKRILLFDDVCTTGTTLNECSRALKRAGAKYVCCLTIAVTMFDEAHI